MLVSGLTKKFLFELWLAQLVTLLRIIIIIIIIEKKSLFRFFSRIWLNNIFQLKVQSRIFTKSLFRLEAETLALFTTEKREVLSENNLT